MIKRRIITKYDNRLKQCRRECQEKSLSFLDMKNNSPTYHQARELALIFFLYCLSTHFADTQTQGFLSLKKRRESLIEI